MARSYLRLALSRRVIVNLKSGSAIEGALFDERGPLLVLKNALLHERGASGPTPMDGDVIVERQHIDFVQAVS